MIQPQQCGQVGFGGPWPVRQTAEANSVWGALPLCVLLFRLDRSPAGKRPGGCSCQGPGRVAGCSHPPREVAAAGEAPRRWAAV